MDVVVLVKQVPDTASNIEIAGDGQTIQLENIKWVMNPYDEIAVEAALRLRDEKGGGSVTILSFGPKRSQEAIRTALAMGADKGILINDPEPYRVDTHTTASVLATALKQIPYDIVFSGARSVDHDNFQTGSAVAQMLDIPQITQVIGLEMGDKSLTCTQITEGGQFVRTCPVPALITTQRGLNDPRYPSLPGIMKAKKKPLEIKELADMGIDEPLAINSRMLSLEFPKPRKAAQMIQEETVKESAARLVQILHNEVKAI